MSIHEPNHLAALHVDTLQRLREALDRIRSLEADVEVYRMGWQQAIHMLHDVIKGRDRLRKQHYLAIDELRALRQTERRAA